MSQTVAIVEDEEHLREAVAEYLAARGFRVLTAADAESFRALARTEIVGVVVLDIAMPGEDGLSLARWLRQWPTRPGVILATASGTAVDRVVGLEVGADDYIVKPYDLRELLARIRALFRRLPAGLSRGVPPAAEAAPAQTIRVGRFIVNMDARRVVDDAGRPLDVTAAEFDLLAALATRPNRVMSRAQLLAGADGRVGDESERSVDIRVTRLRRKIEADPQRPSLICTVRGEGYMFVPPP